MKEVSIVIPAYQSAEWIEASVASCLSQTHPPLEVVVVDDGSTDGTAEICAALGGHVRYEKLANGGVSRARNVGASLTSGEWIVFLDADDVLLPHALEVLVGTAVKADAGVAYGMVIERAAPGSLPRLNGFSFAAGEAPTAARRTLYRGAIITPGSAVVRRDVHRASGGFVTGFEPLEDRDYWAKCGCVSRVAHCDTVVLDKTWRPESHGSQHAKRVFRGQRAQRDLRGWLRERGLDADWMPTDKALIRRALDEAVTWRCAEIVLPLLELAGHYGIRHWKARAYSLFARKRAPSWIGEEPRVKGFDGK